MACSFAFSQLEPMPEPDTGTIRRAKSKWARLATGLREGRKERAGGGRLGAPPNLSNFLHGVVFVSFILLLSSSTVAVETLQFSQTELDVVHEGYVTLSWNAYPSAVEYQVTSTDGHAVYRGPLPKAFISGLADGTYEYHVDALDAGGQVIAASAIPAVIEVKHWSLRLALGLLTCGLVVFVVVVGLIVNGALQTRSQPISPKALSGECK